MCLTCDWKLEQMSLVSRHHTDVVVAWDIDTNACFWSVKDSRGFDSVS